MRTLFINDDVAVKDSTWTVGRRGVAGNFFVMKAVGAAAEAGASLGDGAAVALEKAAATARTSADATKGMLAQRGRASYTGDRSRDSVDAGAMGVAVMFEAVSKAWRGSELEPA